MGHRTDRNEGQPYCSPSEDAEASTDPRSRGISRCRTHQGQIKRESVVGTNGQRR